MRSGLGMMSALLLLAAMGVVALAQGSTGMVADNPLTLIRAGQDQKKAVKIHESIYQAVGFGNTFMVVTPAGMVMPVTMWSGSKA